VTTRRKEEKWVVSGTRKSRVPETKKKEKKKKKKERSSGPEGGEGAVRSRENQWGLTRKLQGNKNTVKENLKRLLLSDTRGREKAYPDRRRRIVGPSRWGLRPGKKKGSTNSRCAANSSAARGQKRGVHLRKSDYEGKGEKIVFARLLAGFVWGKEGRELPRTL